MRVPPDNIDLIELEHRYSDEPVWQGWAVIVLIVLGATAFLFWLCSSSHAAENALVEKDIERVMANAPLLEMEIGTGLPSISGLTAALGPKNARIIISELDRHGYSITKSPSRGENCVLCTKQTYPERRPTDAKMEDALRNGLSLSVSTCFNIYTQNPVGVEQDRRLERCLARVLAGHKIALEMLAREKATSQ